MHTFPTLVLVSLFTSLVAAQKNITVVNTDPAIEYRGENTRDAPICKIDANGNVVAAQPGCYNVPSQCAPTVSMGMSKDSGASFKFKGSAIYVNSLLYPDSPVYTVTLDGVSTDVDGVRLTKGGLECNTLFSKTGLDPNVEHTISLDVKGPSPNRSRPDTDSVIFSLIDFIYTTANDTSSLSSNISSSTTADGLSTGSPSSTAESANAVPTTQSSSAGAVNLPLYTLILGLLWPLLQSRNI